jgi:GxxExxY protein
MKPSIELLYEDLTYEVIGCAFEAFKEVDVGFDEIMYHKVFHRNLLEKGLKAEYKVPAHLDYLGEKVGEFEIDEIVEDKLIVELKSIQTGFLPENQAQILTYLRLTGLRLGLLINFGLHKAFTKRMIFDAQRTDNSEEWDNNYFQSLPAREHWDPVRAATKAVDEVLGPGYHSKLYKAALKIEFDRNQIKYDDHVLVTVKAANIQFDPVEIDYWLIENTLLLGVLAGDEKPRVYDIFRMRSYLKRLGLTHGLIAFWSTKNLQLYGIRVR